MKKLFSSLFIGVAALLAQTVSGLNAAHAATTNQVPNLLPPIGSAASALPTNGWYHALNDGAAFVENTPLTNSILQVEAGVLRGTTSHDIGGFVDVMLPIGGDGPTNSLFGAGFGMAYYNHNFYDATLNARLGGTMTLPVIRMPVYTYIESGGGWNLSQNRAVAQAFAGFTIPWQINDHWTITGGMAVGTVSDLGETVEAIGGSATYHF